LVELIRHDSDDCMAGRLDAGSHADKGARLRAIVPDLEYLAELLFAFFLDLLFLLGISRSMWRTKSKSRWATELATESEKQLATT